MCTDVGRVCHVKKKEMRVKEKEEEEKKSQTDPLLDICSGAKENP